MKIRTSLPKNNKYYIRQANGGYNGAVLGYPTISGANVLCNCVGYANGRFNEIGDYGRCKYQLVCNAENFIESAKKQGLSISATPIQGGIMVWQKGKTLGGADGAGHVAVVEEVYNDGTILTSESGYGSRDWAFKNLRRSNSNGRWGQNSYYKFRGCIINPAVKDAKVVPAPKLTVDGIGGTATVRAMQKFFGTPQDGIISGQTKANAKYYPSLKAVENGKGGSVCIKNLQKWLGISQTGILDQNTVKKWQYMIGVNNDGIFGTTSMKAWQKYLNAHDKATYPTNTPTKPTTPTVAEKSAYKGAFPNTNVVVIGREKVAQKANEYAYKTNDSKAKYPSGKPTEAYKKALASLPYSQHKWDAPARAGANCDVSVWVDVRKAGIDDNFPSGLWKQLNYMQKHNWERIKPSEAKAGDIGFYRKNVSGKHGHIFICYSDNKVKEASHAQYYPKTVNSLSTRLSTKGKKYVYVFRPPNVTRTYLMKGDTGEEVKKLQNYLNWYGNKLSVDGVFGDATDKAVRSMQKALKLTEDGKVGAKTIEAMKKVTK